MVQRDIGSFDTRFDRLTEHCRDAITRGELKPRDRFPSAREPSEMHGVGRTTAGRVHGTLISMSLIEHRPGVGTFVLAPARPSRKRASEASALEDAANKAVHAFDQWRSRSKPKALVEVMDELSARVRTEPPSSSGWACC
jgi:DNA-binding GntR family transcriptional regulator